MKPVYQIEINGETVGYINSKDDFENIIYETFNNNEEENIAFADFNFEIKNKIKLIDRKFETEESKVLSIIKENADITYFEYAIFANGEEQQKFRSKYEANEILENLNKEFKDQVDLEIKKVYMKDLEATDNNVQLAEISNNIQIQIDKKIAEEKKKEKSTINGVYIAVVPVQGHITSRYGARESVRDHVHKGLDIGAKLGTKIKAAADGVVSYSGTKGGYGNLLIINHGNGIETYYGHCSKLYKNVGDVVTAGDIIALVGTTGNSTGPHLHFEIRKNGEYVNPTKYLY